MFTYFYKKRAGVVRGCDFYIFTKCLPFCVCFPGQKTWRLFGGKPRVVFSTKETNQGTKRFCRWGEVGRARPLDGWWIDMFSHGSFLEDGSYLATSETKEKR